jgi:dihydroxyacetone kinase
MGGSSGSLLSLVFTAFATTIKISGEKFNAVVLIAAFSAGLKQIVEIGRAAENDRTMLDALFPALRELQKTGDLRSAAKAAKNGAENTKNMIARAGRASYCKNREETKVPDAGAKMVAIAFEALE